MDLKDVPVERMSDIGELNVAAATTLARVAAFADAPAHPLQAAAVEPDDTELMLRYRSGEVRAFETLYRRHKGPLYRYLQRLCRGQDVANDLFQEVWGKVIASRERYEVRAQFNTYLYRIAHNCAVDYFRRAGRQHLGAMDDVTELADELSGAVAEQPEIRLAGMQVQDSFQHALAQLPAEQRDAFLLYEETGLSLEEIGQVTGVGMETAKSRLRYAVSKLRAALVAHRPRSAEQGIEP
ncbi:MAG TPA: RNA polymerase sigma factor [Povalibacter sp.]|nr:RNA polymerase sigma factor [Povalibacter sp.]